MQPVLCKRTTQHFDVTEPKNWCSVGMVYVDMSRKGPLLLYCAAHPSLNCKFLTSNLKCWHIVCNVRGAKFI